MSNEQECDSSRPACDAAMAQLAATQSRAAAAERELDIAAENITQTMLRSREFMISAEQADAHADAAENLLRRVLACALVGHEADALRQDIQQALVRSHIVRQAAEKESIMPDPKRLTPKQLSVLHEELLHSGTIQDYEGEKARADVLETRLKLIEPLAREEGKAMIARAAAERHADALSDTLSRWHEAIDAACDAAGVAMADSQNAHQEPLARLAALAQEARLWRGHFSASEKDEARSFHANLQLAQDCAIERERADALAQQVAEARALLLRAMNALIGNVRHSELRGAIMSILSKHALARLDAQKETTMDAKQAPSEQQWTEADWLNDVPQPPAVPAPQQKAWWIDHNSKVLRYGWACRITNGEESLWLEPGDAERIAAALNAQAEIPDALAKMNEQREAALLKAVELHGLLREVLAGRGIHTSAQGVFVVELNPDLHRRIRAAVAQEATNAPIR